MGPLTSDLLGDSVPPTRIQPGIKVVGAQDTDLLPVHRAHSAFFLSLIFLSPYGQTVKSIKSSTVASWFFFYSFQHIVCGGKKSIMF
jgi:hypothetical protein